MNLNFFRVPWPVGWNGGTLVVTTYILLNLLHFFKFQSPAIEVSFSYFGEPPKDISQISLSTTVTKGHTLCLLPMLWPPPSSDICCLLSHLRMGHIHHPCCWRSWVSIEVCAQNAIFQWSPDSQLGMPEQPHVPWSPKCAKAGLHPSQKGWKLCPLGILSFGTKAVLLQEGAFVK